MNGKSIFLRPKNLWVTLDSSFFYSHIQSNSKLFGFPTRNIQRLNTSDSPDTTLFQVTIISSLFYCKVKGFLLILKCHSLLFFLSLFLCHCPNSLSLHGSQSSLIKTNQIMSVLCWRCLFFLFFSYLFFLFSFFYLEWVSTVISNALHSQYAHYHFSLSLSTLPLHSCLPQLFTCCSLFISRMFLPQGFCTCYLFFKTSCLIWPWLTPSVHGFLQCHLPSRVLYDPLFKIILILPTQKSKSPFPEFSPKLFYFYWHIWFIFGLPKPELSTMRGEIWGFCSIHL